MCVCVCVCVCATDYMNTISNVQYNSVSDTVLRSFKQSDVNIHVMVSLRGLLHAVQPLSSMWITAITLNLATRAFHTVILTLIVIGMILGLGHFLPAWK